jgi:hypothetical protein
VFKLYVGIVKKEGSGKKYTSASGTQGIGKSGGVVRDGVRAWLQDDALCFTNFKTHVPGTNKSWSYVMNFHDIIETLTENQDEILAADKPVWIGLQELWKIVRYFENVEKQSFYGTFTNQLRKFNTDISADTQRFMDIPPGLRDNIDQTLLPCKVHDDGEICREPRCRAHHTIEVRQVIMRERGSPDFVLVDSFDMAKYGLFYNSFKSEIIEEPGDDGTEDDIEGEADV